MGAAYVYYSYEEYGRGYIGSRLADPVSDDAYMGSYRDKSYSPTHKIILGVYDTLQEALAAEVALHEFFDVARNPHFANQAKQTSTKFSTAGRPSWNAGKETPSSSYKRSKETKQKMREGRLKMLENRSKEERSRIAKLGHKSRKPLDRMWITNGKENLYVSKNHAIPEGWRRGRHSPWRRG